MNMASRKPIDRFQACSHKLVNTSIFESERLKSVYVGQLGCFVFISDEQKRADLINKLANSSQD